MEKNKEQKLKNKNKKLLRAEINEMLSHKEEKLSKDNLIDIWKYLNNIK